MRNATLRHSERSEESQCDRSVGASRAAESRCFAEPVLSEAEGLIYESARVSNKKSLAPFKGCCSCRRRIGAGLAGLIYSPSLRHVGVPKGTSQSAFKPRWAYELNALVPPWTMPVPDTVAAWSRPKRLLRPGGGRRHRRPSGSHAWPSRADRAGSRADRGGGQHS